MKRHHICHVSYFISVLPFQRDVDAWNVQGNSPETQKWDDEWLILEKGQTYSYPLVVTNIAMENGA